MLYEIYCIKYIVYNIILPKDMTNKVLTPMANTYKIQWYLIMSLTIKLLNHK